jgi:hypothetical protein
MIQLTINGVTYTTTIEFDITTMSKLDQVEMYRALIDHSLNEYISEVMTSDPDEVAELTKNKWRSRDWKVEVK